MNESRLREALGGRHFRDFPSHDNLLQQYGALVAEIVGAYIAMMPPAHIVAAAQDGVESGTIKGGVVEWCEKHGLPVRTNYADDWQGVRECEDHPYSNESCSIGFSLRIPVVDVEKGGEE